MFSSVTQPPPRHNFVSAITFEGFKLRSSNLTHAIVCYCMGYCMLLWATVGCNNISPETNQGKHICH